MKILKLLIFFALGIFLISNASAMVLTGLWSNNAASLSITVGNSASFTVDFGSEHPPVTISESLYNSNSQLIWQNLRSGLSSGYVTDLIPSSYLSAGSYQLIINGNDNAGYAWNDVLSLIVNSQVVPPTQDIIPPIIILNFPADNLVSTSSSIIFSANVSDNIAVSNVSLYINGILNQTNSSGLNNTNYAFTLNLANGTYLWKYQACDTSGNCVLSQNRALTINLPFNQTNQTPILQIQFIYPTPADGSTLVQDSIPVSVSITNSLPITNIQVFLYDSTYSLIRNVSISSQVTFMGLVPGTYFLNATVTDNSGNSASTETRTITLVNPTPTPSYSYNDVYQNYINQLKKINSGITTNAPKSTPIFSFDFAILLFEILFILVLVGVIIFIIAKRRYQ